MPHETAIERLIAGRQPPAAYGHGGLDASSLKGVERPHRPVGPDPSARRGARLAVTLAVIGLMTVPLAGCGNQPDSSETVYRILVQPCAGPDNQRATAVAVGADLLLTVAHSFEEAESFTVTDNEGQDVAVDIVYLDQSRDIAALRPLEPVEPLLSISQPEVSADVSITTFGDRDGPITRPGRILELIDATMDGEGRRAAIRLDASLEPGDSGAPVVNDQTEMVGMIFAKARGSDVGWAVSSEELVGVLDELADQEPEAISLSC